MPAKRFGATEIPASTPTIIASGASNTDSTVNFVINNHSLSSIEVTMAYSADGCCAPSVEEYLRPVKTIIAGEFYEVRGVALEADHHIVVMADKDGATALAYGFVEAI